MKVAVFFLAALVFLNGCGTMLAPNDHWFSRDKAKHFAVSAAISGVCTPIVKNNGVSDSESLPIAVGFSVSIGLGKEAYDLSKENNGWSWKDVFWDVLGAVSGFYIAEGLD